LTKWALKVFFANHHTLESKPGWQVDDTSQPISTVDIDNSWIPIITVGIPRLSDYRYPRIKKTEGKATRLAIAIRQPMGLSSAIVGHHDHIVDDNDMATRPNTITKYPLLAI
jgi:hypothetical protein